MSLNLVEAWAVALVAVAAALPYAGDAGVGEQRSWVSVGLHIFAVYVVSQRLLYEYAVRRDAGLSVLRSSGYSKWLLGGSPADCHLVAHRCGAGEAPENTLTSLQRAVSLQGGARRVALLQLDLMQTKDKELILMHDTHLEKNLEKLTGASGEVKDFIFDELPEWKEEVAANVFCPTDTPAIQVPSPRKFTRFEDACRELQ